jgi:hypothetical protein
MASPRESIGGRHPTPAEPDDSSMCTILGNLVAQPCSTFESLSDAIDIALRLFAEAPAELSIPASVYRNLGVLFERRYRWQKDFDDLQTATTWAEQGADTKPLGDVDRIRCLSNLTSYLMARYDTTGCPEDLDEAKKRIVEALYECRRNLNVLNPFESETCVHVVETSCLVLHLELFQVSVLQRVTAPRLPQPAPHGQSHTRARHWRR